MDLYVILIAVIYRLNMTPKTIKKVRSFLKGGTTNREFEAYLAFRCRTPWPYSIPLESVVSYMKYFKDASID